MQTKIKEKNYTYFHITVFKEKSKLLTCILELIGSVASTELASNITKVYCNIFNKEYKEFFFANKMDDTFIKIHKKYYTLSIDVLDVHNAEIYKNLLNKLILLDFDYDSLLQIKSGDDYQLGK